MASVTLRLALQPCHRHHHHHRSPSALLPLPKKSTLLPQLSQFRLRSPPPITTTRCSYIPPSATDRLISAASYFFPFLNGLQYGGFLFAKYPILAVPFEPLIPLLSRYNSMPYASFVAFYDLYLGVVRNPNLSRYARFNALQALALDMLLGIPGLLQMIISPDGKGIGLDLTAWTCSGIFVFLVACFVYGLVSSIVGKTPYLPIVTPAAASQFG